ncbi:hypothetical protein [Paraglaciecola psychrophila]|uniref:Uncharacterized protein n=1 Tax=Paraglaciecola psychrophila 170 TaxID=1129794 RepID=K7A6Q2_9ALTE|nr:hypothetical protein [Paraglaciecola psychrophila]AGH47393.1 hypothetical protein C427_5296 [Paraglaciecola psychrophila 170]GAC36478.1 hypothetical protein GPSY_0840 [Paraglaciecola psychrophila 170]
MQPLAANQALQNRFSHISINLTAETKANPMFLVTLENRWVLYSLLCQQTANAILCEMLKKGADLTGNTMIASRIEQESVAKSLTELGIEFAQGNFDNLN